MTIVPIGEWLPDLPAINNPGALEALNVIPASASYRPIASPLVSGNAASTSTIQGAISARGTDLSVRLFSGDGAKLYKFDGVNWSDVSRLSGGAYTVPATAMWRFTQFGDLLIAVNGVDAPQKFVMSSGANFTALGGTPPLARYVATVRDF